MRALLALFLASGALGSTCDPNPCLIRTNPDIVFDETKTTCVEVNRQCLTSPCPQYDCLDCAATLCAAVYCEPELRVQEGCCFRCLPVDPVDPCLDNPCADATSSSFDPTKQTCIPEPKACLVEPCPQYKCVAVDVACTEDVRVCGDGTVIARDPALNCEFGKKCAEDSDPCLENPCADNTRADYDPLTPICLPTRDEAAPFRCTNICETEAPCINPSSEGYEFDKPHCVYSPKACLTMPCPQFTCEKLDCSLVRCMQLECGENERKTNCCGPCQKIPTPVCADDVLECNGGFLVRDPLTCEFPKCEEKDPCRPNPCPSSDASKPVCLTDENGATRCEALHCELVDCAQPLCTRGQHIEVPLDGCCGTCVDDEMCDMSVKECQDGKTWVARDPKNHCEYQLCPDEAQPCTLDARICPDGSSVGRDYANHCEFFACPNPCDANPCPSHTPLCVVNWEKGNYECSPLNCANIACLAIAECGAGFELELVGCCPQCVPANSNPCVPNPCSAAAPYCIASPKQCFAAPCYQWECTSTEPVQGSESQVGAVHLTPAAVAGVSIGAVTGGILLLVGALFLCRAQLARKKGTPLNSRQGSPDQSRERGSSASQLPYDNSIIGTASLSVAVEPPTDTAQLPA